MQNIKIIATLLFLASSFALVGCGGNGLATVSGTVTYNGEPVPKLRVVFSPKPIGDNHSPGPFSSGITDDQGKFTLKSRYGDQGAFVGEHTVAFEYTDIGETAMLNLVDELADAQEEGDKEEFEAIQKKMEAMKAKLSGRPLITEILPVTAEVPAGGTSDLVLEMKTKEE